MRLEGRVGRSAQGSPNLRLRSHSPTPSPEEGFPAVRTELPGESAVAAGALGGTERQAGRAEARPAGASASPTAAPRTGSALLCGHRLGRRHPSK